MWPTIHGQIFRKLFGSSGDNVFPRSRKRGKAIFEIRSRAKQNKKSFHAIFRFFGERSCPNPRTFKLPSLCEIFGIRFRAKPDLKEKCESRRPNQRMFKNSGAGAGAGPIFRKKTALFFIKSSLGTFMFHCWRLSPQRPKTKPLGTECRYPNVFPRGVSSDFLLVFLGFPMVVLLFSIGFLRFSYGFPMVFLRFS